MNDLANQMTVADLVASHMRRWDSVPSRTVASFLIDGFALGLFHIDGCAFCASVRSALRRAGVKVQRVSGLESSPPAETQRLPDAANDQPDLPWDTCAWGAEEADVKC